MTRVELHERWQKRMQDFETSDLTGTQWCTAQGIPLCQFRYWRRKLRHNSPDTNRWMTVGLDHSTQQEPLFIYVGSAKVEVHTGFDPDLFADVVRVLRAL
ncbi:IS66 family insertion sequence element accessory protein TnpA [Sporolactobacillus nakayamae]|uniref:Uncharacterized protein n=1 Tax=Sporolactobacillus nakayamae TaxID=269670 RepID=A0A1I2V9B0_9BACL|nr:hypothetical protein [Sporolactobacillus nakayamae]SFG85710.1 hypothetical protein SAMN02982927_03009 [Sporolactobacillus nakayamae]